VPKPLLLARPSGLYVRFLVPADLRRTVGARFIVRPLHLPRGDAARLVAARLGLALSGAFDALRGGRSVDINEILRRARAGGIKELTIKGLKLPNGISIEAAEVNNLQDEEMLQRLLAQLAETDPLTAAAHGYVEPAPAAPKGPLLGKAVGDHLADLERARLAPKTLMESRHTLRLFLEVVGEDVPVSEISQDHVRDFFEVVRWWPANATKRAEYKGKSVREVVELAKVNNEPQPAAFTQAKHRQRLSVFLSLLVKAKLIPVNPLAGVRPVAATSEEDKGEPFNDSELGKIFGPEFVAWASKYPHRWFGSIIGLYSGARVAEVAQLRLDDIETVDGVPGFHVRKTSEGQRIKNANSRRFVPFAKPVLDAGILSYVEDAKAAGHERLFPNLPNGGGVGFGPQLSKQFSSYIKSIGITAKGQGFHGFRHTFASKLDEAGVSEAAIAAITGHSRSGSVLSRHYIDRSTLPDRVATLAKFVPPVSLPAYTAGQFAGALADAPIKLVKRKPMKVGK
jgi:integrase